MTSNYFQNKIKRIKLVDNKICEEQKWFIWLYIRYRFNW